MDRPINDNNNQLISFTNERFKFKNNSLKNSY